MLQRSAADCSEHPTVQAWLTETLAKPTWRHQPAEQVKLPAPTVTGDVPDVTAPSAAPLVSSLDCPAGSTGPGHGGTGLPGAFTFKPAGGTDVAVLACTPQSAFCRTGPPMRRDPAGVTGYVYTVDFGRTAVTRSSLGVIRG